MSLFFIEIQRNGLLRAKRVVFLDSGHNLTSFDLSGLILCVYIVAMNNNPLGKKSLKYVHTSNRRKYNCIIYLT
mgnify:CR=1 FL=1